MPACKEIEWVKNTSGCYICTSHKSNTKGYPQKWFQGKHEPVSRIIWILERGKIPEGLCVLHKCDNPGCIRIDHLFIGTHADNTRDMLLKGRQSHKTGARGENHRSHKLTWEQVKIIRADTRLQRIIALEYNVTSAAISCIKRNKTWRNYATP